MENILIAIDCYDSKVKLREREKKFQIYIGLTTAVIHKECKALLIFVVVVAVKSLWKYLAIECLHHKIQ